MAIEIVDLPIKHGGSFHSYVSLPSVHVSQLCFVELGHRLVGFQTIIISPENISFYHYLCCLNPYFLMLSYPTTSQSYPHQGLNLPFFPPKTV